MKRTLVKFTLVITSLLVVIVSADANSPVYQVEMIIFSHLTTNGVTQEQWPRINPPPTNFPNTITLDSENATGYYEQLPSAKLIMQREQSELNRDPAYRTLLHTAWRQPFIGAKTPILHIYGGHEYPTKDQPQWSVNGTARVSVDHYFNVKLNLFFAVPEKNLARLDNGNYFHPSDDLMYFHVVETRRMKSKELNYIDHPLFGVLIKIIPIKSST